MKYIIIIVLFCLPSCQEMHEDYYKYPYIVTMSNNGGWTATGILVDSFNMVTENQIIVYRNGVKSQIVAHTIFVKQNEHFKSQAAYGHKKYKMKKYLEIRSIRDNSCVKRIDVTGKTERGVERVERGILINLNHDEYTVEERDSRTELPLDGD